MFQGLARSLSRAVESALARTFGQSVSRSIGDWWGWAPLLWAVLAAIVALLILKAIRSSRPIAYSIAAGAFVFCVFAITPPLGAWIQQSHRVDQIKRELRRSLIDPSSAQISVPLIRERRGGGYIGCGWVNARARNGAYQGAQVFAVAVDDDQVVVLVEPACRIDIGYPFDRRDSDCSDTTRTREYRSYGIAHELCPGFDDANLRYPPP